MQTALHVNKELGGPAIWLCNKVKFQSREMTLTDVNLLKGCCFHVRRLALNYATHAEPQKRRRSKRSKTWLSFSSLWILAMCCFCSSGPLMMAAEGKHWFGSVSSEAIHLGNASVSARS